MLPDKLKTYDFFQKIFFKLYAESALNIKELTDFYFSDEIISCNKKNILTLINNEQNRKKHYFEKIKHYSGLICNLENLKGTSQ